MNGQEIRTKIDSLYMECKSLLKPGFFTLNKKVMQLRKEIKELQKQCPHEFKEGKCIYCDKEEEK